MKNILVLLIFFTSAIAVRSQTQTQIAQESPNWMTKYWLYRWRLVNDFIKIGDQQGESIPFAERNSYNQQDLKSGDGTQKIGMYICVLATEYALLYENERWTDLEKTKTELYYALEAIERLDCTTEEYQPYNFASNSFINCNGYLGRDDIHAGFLDEPAKHWDLSDPTTNRDFINRDFTKFCYPHGLGEVTDLHDYAFGSGFESLNGSDFINLQLDPSSRHNEPNKDQYLCLWQGLGLVSKLVHDYDYTVTRTDGSTVIYNFYEKARELYWRLIDNMKYATISGVPTYLFIDWLTTTPLGQITQYGGDVSAGIAIPFSFPIAQAANKVIFNENGAINNLAYLNIPVGFHDILTIASYDLFWQFTLIDFSNQSVGGTVNQSMYCQLAAMSDSWRIGLINATPQGIYDHAEDYDWEGYYMTLWSVWNDKPIPNMASLRTKTINAVRDDLNSAPCEGPYNINPINTTFHFYPPQWASTFKYFRGLDETHNGDSDLPQGYYNGLDYLLMHNLFYLMYNGGLPFYQDLIDRVIDYPAPGTSPFLDPNSIPQPLVLNAFHTITANNVVESTFDVDFRAGYDITLKPGFHVEAGADFHAFVDPFTCVNGEYRNEISDSDLVTAYGFNEKFNFTHHGIIDYSSEKTEEEVSMAAYENIDSSKLLLIYPNPNDGRFTYMIPEKSETDLKHLIEVYNSIGDLVHSESLNYTEQNIIDLNRVTPGIYVFRVISGKSIYVSKILIEE